MPLLNRIVIDDTAYNTDPENPAAAYWFDAMEGHLQPKRREVEVFTRPGVPGESIRSLGERAKRSTLTTLLGVVDQDAVQAALSAYRELIDGNPHLVIQRGADRGYVKIIDVDLVGEKPLVTISQWLNPSATVAMYVAWTVISCLPPPTP